MEQTPFFEEHDLEAMFAAFDVTDKGYITPKQYEQGTASNVLEVTSSQLRKRDFLYIAALLNLGIEWPTLRMPESISTINLKLFIRSVYVPDLEY